MKQFSLVLMLFIILSLKSSFKEPLLEIDPNKFTDNEVLLSDISDNITYITLENKAPLGVIYTHKVVNDLVYLSAKDIGVLVFNKNGFLLRKIGSIGNGPEEYHYFMSFDVDERTGNVFVLDRDKVKVYSHNGKFIRDIKYGDYIGGRMTYDIKLFNSLLFIPDGLSMGESTYNWIFLDTLGNLMSKKKNSIEEFKTNMKMGGSIYRFEDKLFYYNFYNDTIFSISPDLSSRGNYLFAKGSFRWPRGLQLTKENYRSELKSLFKPGKMFETKHYVVMEYSYLDKWAIALIDKVSKKILLGYKNEKKSVITGKTKPCIINDIDGGFPLSGDFQFHFEKSTEYITTLITSLDVKKYVSSDEFKSIVPKYPEKKKEVEKLANSLSETDNPVLMMVRLKK